MSPGSQTIPHSSLLRSLGLGTLVTFFLSFGGCLGELPLHPAPTASATPATVAAAREVQGSLSFPYLVADAGNFSVQAGETITIAWRDAPAGAQRYEILFRNEDGSVESLPLLDDPAAGIVRAAWDVPPGRSGALEGLAYFADGSQVRSGCCAQVYTGGIPPAGICSLRVPGMMPQQLYQEQDETSVRLIGVTPGLYLQVLALAPDGWYRVQAPPVEGGAGATGWLHAVDGLNLYGPCEDLPQSDPLRLEGSPPLTPGWQELRDSRTGVGLVLPCFWRADLPTLEDYGAGRTGTLRNFTLFPLEQAFVEDIFEAGAIQVDLTYLRRDVPGATAFQRMTSLAAELGQGPRELRTLEINGQPALQVEHENASGRSRYTLFELPDRTFLLFAPNAGASDHPDVLAILSSIALSPQTPVLAPRIKPASPPFEADASCLWGDLDGERYHKADSEGSTP